MVYLRVKMNGTGQTGDPFTAPLPHFAMVSCDYAAGTCIVEVPARLFPPGAGQIGVTRIAVPNVGNVITGISPGDRQKVADWLDQNYPDFSGQFRPQLQ